MHPAAFPLLSDSVVVCRTGLSIGKEGPFVHLAAMIGRNMAYYLKPFHGLWRVRSSHSPSWFCDCEIVFASRIFPVK